MAKKKSESAGNITSILREKRVFKPSPEFSKKAHVKSFTQYKRTYKDSIWNIQKFWAKAARDLTWFERWNKTLEWKVPFSKWFIGGKINVSYNCLDRHLTTWRRNKAAILWEGEPGES